MEQPQKIQTLQGRGLPLRGNDIDTDRIIPARYLRCVIFDGLGEHVFADDRHQGSHPFDQPQYQEAKILVVNGNFGCGSSREHAPQAIARWGIQGILGESFAEIFLGNCVAMGIPCLTSSPDAIQALQTALETDPTLEIQVDLNTLTAKTPHHTLALTMAEGIRQMLISGQWDACGQLLANRAAIQTTAATLPYLAWRSA